MTYRIIVKLKNAKELIKFRKLVHDKNKFYSITRGYHRSSWDNKLGPHQAYVVDCKSEKAMFKLAMMFTTEKYLL